MSKGHSIRQSNKWILFISIFIIGVFYISRFSNNFFETMDDDWGIYKNPVVQDLNKENLIKIWANETMDMFYLPLTFTSFAVDVALWGNNAKLMKIENLALLFATGVLIYYFLSLIGVSSNITLFTTLLFFVHPMQLESVALPTGRRQILSLLFLIVSCIGVYKYLITKSGFKFCILALIGFILSLGGKPSSVIFLPFFAFIVFVEKIWFKNSKIHWGHFFRVLISFIVIAIFFMKMNIEAGERNFLRQDFHYSIFQHILIVLSSFAIILKKIFIGPYLIFVPIDEYNHFSYFTYIIASGFTVILIGLVFRGLKNKIRWLVYGIAWFLIALIPSSLILLISSDFPMNTSDRYFMLASPGILLVIVYGLAGLNRQLAYIFLTFFSIYLLFLSIRQFNYWQNTITLVEYNVKIVPTKDMLYKLAESYYNDGDTNQALTALKRAVKIERKETFPTPSYGFIVLAKIANKGGEESLAEFFVLKALQTDIEDKQLLKNKRNELRQLIDGINFNDDDVDNFNQYRLMKQKLIYQ